MCRDADAVLDDVREYVVEHLRDKAAVLVMDETGGVKKGNHTVGSSASTAARPRGSSSQVAAYLVYASTRGPATVDRELYHPRS
ncbi:MULTISPECIES: transposase [unclassified Streptomyces]|uniref:transposase n=1 Tax=unclassified Streptomyces TaxID=2593676 RepID=UPI0036B9932F